MRVNYRRQESLAADAVLVVSASESEDASDVSR